MTMSEDVAAPPVESPKPEKLSQEQIDQLDKAELVAKVAELQAYVEELKVDDVQALKESEDKCRQQLSDVNRREGMLLKTLTEKEREIADLAAQVEELKQYQLPSTAQLRTMLLEPTVNVVINKLRKELDSTKTRLEESQSELSAWKFTQDSQTGKQLMSRCRTLLKENEELGKQISQGRIAKLEGEIALEKKLVEEMRVAQDETEQFVMELDDDTEGLQATIYVLQQKLKEATDRVSVLESNQNTPTAEELPNIASSTIDSHSHSDEGGAYTADHNAQLTHQNSSQVTERHEQMQTEGTSRHSDIENRNLNGDAAEPLTLEIPPANPNITDDGDVGAMTPTNDENDPTPTEMTDPTNQVTTCDRVSESAKIIVGGNPDVVSEKLTAQSEALTQQQTTNGHAEMLVN